MLLVSTGSEESFMEGMQAFAAPALRDAARDRTHVVCVDTVGSPTLMQLEGEGMLVMRDYPAELQGPRRRRSRTRPASSCVRGLPLPQRDRRPDRAERRLPAVMLGSVNEFKVPSNYHWPTDTAENVDYETRRRAASASATGRSGGSRRARRRRRPAAGARPSSSASSRVDDLARERASAIAASSSPSRGPRLDAELRGQLVAAHQRRAAARPRASASASAEQLARELEVPGDRLVGACARASRGGRRRDSSVTSASTGSQADEVAVDVRGGPAAARGRGSRAAGDGA